MRIYKYSILIILLAMSTTTLLAQKDRKITFVGGARSLLFNNQLSVSDTVPDTTSAKKNNGGYAIIDLGININPNKNTEIMGMFRIRNEYGGFWGAGVQFDVRQLWVKGIIANSVRYQIGDLNLKQSEFSLYNHHADQIDSMPEVFKLQQNIVNYDKFYLNNHTWRMQGANVDFGLTFNKFIEEINFNTFIARINATNFASTPDRLMAGTSIHIIQSKNIQLGYNYSSVFDVKGTIADNNVFNNTINTFELKLNKNLGNQNININTEVGTSNYNYSADTLAPKLNDYFIHSLATLNFTKIQLKASVGYLNVGPEFRSIGAQSKDVDYTATPNNFNRITNTQYIRPINLLDLISNDNIYSRTISSSLMGGSQLYNNAMPYGIATFNRLGMYSKIQYTHASTGIDINAEYYNLREIKGQGSAALTSFNVMKLYAGIPFHKMFGLQKILALHVGTKMEQTSRTSSDALENIDLKTNQITAGIRWEFVKNFELLGGYVIQNSDGNEYTADRDAYTSVTYYTLSTYKMNQQIASVGVRYNFNPKIYLCALYQNSTYTNKIANMADYKINQFGLIYNIIL